MHWISALHGTIMQSSTIFKKKKGGGGEEKKTCCQQCKFWFEHMSTFKQQPLVTYCQHIFCKLWYGIGVTRHFRLWDNCALVPAKCVPGVRCTKQMILGLSWLHLWQCCTCCVTRMLQCWWRRRKYVGTTFNMDTMLRQSCCQWTAR